ncbi:MAG: hypothetical protein AVDCRST_MAG95-3176 [uncultured Adhaeribacter sp.]|uniref:Uncharacterized protein n=1 Tax=uncultured Adhaeribacter sp. TaxID=448109 RepID=A0A6J4JF76_9BACT|nr:MAG: hypothetical protein AVDCRST_MAG95-3176 [uncultured Adhaeribacter sp.]
MRIIVRPLASAGVYYFARPEAYQMVDTRPEPRARILFASKEGFFNQFAKTLI